MLSRPNSSDNINNYKNKYKLKTQNITSILSDNFKITWAPSRIFTPLYTAFLVGQDGLVPIKFTSNDTTQLTIVRSGLHSHGLFYNNKHTLAGSVTTNIKKEKSVKREKNLSFDKDQIDNERKDFMAIRLRHDNKTVFYVGAHIIDDKYRAACSNKMAINYFPANHYYNHPLKETLVKIRAGENDFEYIEILIYTDKPPQISVRSNGPVGNKYDIPVGVILMRIRNNSIEDAYYFPNNNYDYESIRDQNNLKGKKDIGNTMASWFRLKQSLLYLLLPASLVDAETASDKTLAEQQTYENTLYNNMTTIYSGDIYEDEHKKCIFNIANAVFQNSNTNPHDFFENENFHEKNMCQNTLQIALNALGKFIVTYAIRNALKSEYIGTQSRLFLVEVITSLIENYVTDEKTMETILYFFECQIADSFQIALNELINTIDTLSINEHFQFANIYSHLSDPANDFLINCYDPTNYASTGYDKLYDNSSYTKQFVKILRHLIDKFEAQVPTLTKNQRFQLLELLISAQNAIAYQYINGFPDEDLEEETSFLKSKKSYAMGLLETILQAEKDTNSPTQIEYQFGIRSTIGLMFQEINTLGTKKSILYNEDLVISEEPFTQEKLPLVADIKLSTFSASFFGVVSNETHSALVLKPIVRPTFL